MAGLATSGGVPPLLVMIHHNRPDLTVLALESLGRNTPEPHRLLLIDNASGDALPGLSAHELLVNPARLSFSANCNQGLPRGSGGPVVLLNNDLYFPPGWLAGLLAGLEQGCGVVGAVSNFELPLDLPWPGGRLRLPPQAEPGDLPPGAWPYLDKVLGAYNQGAAGQPPRPRAFVSFYAVALSSQAVERLGGLEEGFIQGCEDLDYCLRAWQAGLSVGQAPGAYVAHFSGRATLAGAQALASRDRHNLPLLLGRWPLAAREELAARWREQGLEDEGRRLWDGLERRLAGLGPGAG
ncbi:MAG: glycosyltransferase [Desulfarculus sp.]|nr:glycosyltransferase [Desulfarculus sp.]